jgi:hypothetical protein
MACLLKRQRRRRRDRNQCFRSERSNLFDQFEGAAACNDNKATGRAYASPAKGSNQLVESVVTTDILAYVDNRSIEANPGRRMNRMCEPVQGLPAFKCGQCPVNRRQ